MKKILYYIHVAAFAIWIPATDLGAQRELDRDILSQSRSQQSVGRSVQTTISDLGDLIADLESNGLLEDTMVAKMRSAQEVLSSIGKDSIPEATAKLRAAALSAVGRSENLTQATNEIDSILKELKKTARDVGDEQKRSAYGQILSQLLTQNQDLQDQTQKWGEEQLTDPEQSGETRDEVMEKQSDVESQFDALKQMLDKEIAFQEDSSLKEELQNVLDALEGQKFEEFEGNLPQDMQQGLPQFETSDNLSPPPLSLPETSHIPPSSESHNPQAQTANPESHTKSEPKDPRQSSVSDEKNKSEPASRTKGDSGTQDQPDSKSEKKDPNRDNPIDNKTSHKDPVDPSKKDDSNGKPTQKNRSQIDKPTDAKPKDSISKPEKEKGQVDKAGEGKENQPKDPNTSTKPVRKPVVENNKGEKREEPSRKADNPKVAGTQTKENRNPKDSTPEGKEANRKRTDQKSGKTKDLPKLAQETQGKKEEKSPSQIDSSSKKKNKVPSAEKSLEKSGKAITANDAGTALDAQKEFQERLSKALAAMGSAMAQNLQLEGSSEGNSPMGASSMTSLPLTPPSLDSFSGMAFGSESSGSEIGDADLDALLSGEDSETQSGSGEGEGQSAKGDESPVAATGLPSGVPSPPQGGGKPQGGSQKEKGKPGNPNPKMPSPGKGGGSKAASLGSANPFAPPMNMPGAGAPGEGSGTSTAMFDKPHGTHFETTAIKGGGGPVKGSYQKTEQSRRNLAEVARQKIQQDYQRRLPAEYRLMTAEYFELLGSMEE